MANALKEHRRECHRRNKDQSQDLWDRVGFMEDGCRLREYGDERRGKGKWLNEGVDVTHTNNYDQQLESRDDLTHH